MGWSWASCPGGLRWRCRLRGWRGGWFDGEVREYAVDPAGQPPVRAPGQVHHGGDEEGAQEEGVEQDRGGHAEADLADDLLAGEDEGAEYQDHDGGGGDDDAAGGGLACAHGLVVVFGCGPFLADAGDQEYLVVHGQAEQDGGSGDGQGG